MRSGAPEPAEPPPTPPATRRVCARAVGVNDASTSTATQRAEEGRMPVRLAGTGQHGRPLYVGSCGSRGEHELVALGDDVERHEVLSGAGPEDAPAVPQTIERAVLVAEEVAA